MDTELKNKSNKIYFVIIAIVIILFIFCYYMFTSVTITLNGNNPYILNYSYKYEEMGFTATNGFGKDVSDNVTIYGTIDEYKEGSQILEYVYESGSIRKTVNREVIVLENHFKEYDFVINGDKTIYTLENSLYDDLGAYIVKKDTNEIINNIQVDNNVNIFIPGEYEVTYSYSFNGEMLFQRRKVIVLPKNEVITTTNNGTNGRITIDFSIVDDFTKIMLPDGSFTTNANVIFDVIANGEYHFIVYGNNDKVLFDKKVVVTELVSDLKCTGELKVSGTYLKLSTNITSISKVSWEIDGEMLDGTNEIRIDKRVTNAFSEIELSDGTKNRVSCSISSNLAYNFIYDENNTKEYMKCSTYTEQDRITLEAKLKQAVNEAGYGTRAGVVEAARFLVGGLDYKVPYLGPKTVDDRLGIYSKAGLNIGYKDGWGCMVSGWRQGMDCVYFVIWAFKQNNLYPNNFYDKANTFKTRDSVGNLKVGDFLLTPCSSNCEGKSFTHIGIIIGIDNKNIYVAEATTGSIDAIVVTKYDKFNMPASGKFSVAKPFKYASEGNVTNMWIS